MRNDGTCGSHRLRLQQHPRLPIAFTPRAQYRYGDGVGAFAGKTTPLTPAHLLTVPTSLTQRALQPFALSMFGCQTHAQLLQITHTYTRSSLICCSHFPMHAAPVPCPALSPHTLYPSTLAALSPHRMCCQGRPMQEFLRLLHVVIVGGGPTGVEVAGELSNLINRDLKQLYPDRAKAMR